MHLTTGFETFLYVYEADNAKVVCPISERTYNGYTDIVTPYGFSGFISTGEVESFQKNWRSFAKEKGYVCGYIGLNPLLENTSLYHNEVVYTSNTLFVFDLRQSLADLFTNLSENRKRQLKAFDYNSENFVLDREQLKAFFLKNYHSFFLQRKASFISEFTFDTLEFLSALENIFMVGYAINGNLEAISVFSYSPHVAEYLFNISTDAGKAFAVPLIWYAVHYFKSKEIAYLNLGGGVKPGDSIAQFKTRFGVNEYPLKSLKQVYNEEIYSLLCKEKGVDPADKNSYFPLYRQN